MEKVQNQPNMSSAPTVIVIGAGWSGLVAAATYLQVNPDISLTVLDDSESPGGVWSRSRLYPGLIANSPNGLYEFSDLTMVDEKHPEYELIPAERVQEYLEKYARFKGVYERIRFGVRVVKARRRGAGGWEVETEKGEVLSCDKLIVSTGLSSKPKLPDIPKESYTGTSFHSKFLGPRHEAISADPTVKEVVVVGGCKSGVETCALFVAAGKKVNWVVRPSEQGVPIVVVDPDFRPNLVAVNSTRLFSMWSPSIFNTTGWAYRILHSSIRGLGAWIWMGFWTLMTKSVSAGSHYSSSNGKKIRPEGNNFFWDAPYISLLYTSSPFLKYLADEDKMKVYREKPTKLVSREMELGDGSRIGADAVVWCTGWQPSIDFFEDKEARRLGIPIRKDDPETLETERMWLALAEKGDRTVRDLLPQLGAKGRTAQELSPFSQFRMYRQVLSPRLFAEGDRSIAFCGFISSGQTSQSSELLALWAVAWMEDLMPTPLPSQTEMENEVAKTNAWMARRYGPRGAKDPEIILEIQTFLDVLIRDLGLEVERKRKGILGSLKEWLIPYKASDYAGIVDELLRNRKAKLEM